jgi:succinylarginine dihydrolase
MMASAYEINFDGLVGPTHNYAGLSYGNVASMKNKAAVSSPKQAALQGLEKMRLVAGLSVKQAVLPPHQRPDVATLRALGFRGSDGDVLRAAQQEDPALLAAVCSSSNMWTANAATISPSADTADGKVHFTPANLISQFHRSLEPPTTARLLKAIFPETSDCFVHHSPLPCANHLSDEGAANQTRLARAHGEPGVEIFVYGRRAFDGADAGPRKFPARQTLEACAAIARNHQLDPTRVIFLRQSPAAIDAGAFHNDVVSVGNENVLLYHQAAYADADAWRKMSDANPQMRGVVLPAAQMPLADAVSSYVFNSQLVTLPDRTMVLIAPGECMDYPNVQDYIDSIVGSEGPIRSVKYVDVRQSMQNGGGPACLRLRVVLTEAEMAKMNTGVLWTESLHARLVEWVDKHYRDRLTADDLVDPKLVEESRAALDELTHLLQIGPVYEFQRSA